MRHLLTFEPNVIRKTNKQNKTSGGNKIKLECVKRQESVWFRFLTHIFTLTECHVFKVPESIVLNIQQKSLFTHHYILKMAGKAERRRLKKNKNEVMQV